MKKMLLFISGLAFWSSCYYDNASELHPGGGTCDTVNVTYNEDLVPLFQSNCGTNNSCHSSSLAEGGVILDNYAAAVATDDVTLIGSVQHWSGYIAMPPSGKLSDCGIRQIEIWIQNGKPQ
jgi:hypothetical protein